jgi:hypothetical protein
VKSLQATKKSEAEIANTRASTTDPDARVMRMGDGGYRPAYNLQLAADTASGVVVGVGVTNSGSDARLIGPMLDDVERRTGNLPKEWLVDGGYVDLQDIQGAGEKGVGVLAPITQSKSSDVDPHAPKKGDPEHVAAWRRRMGTDRAEAIYRERAATAERVNADLRAHRGLKQLPVRGIGKIPSIGLWVALTYNVLAWIGPPPLA